MRGIAIPKGIDYIFQKKKNHYFLFSLNFFFKKKNPKYGSVSGATTPGTRRG
jgi:hypothetical protein